MGLLVDPDDDCSFAFESIRCGFAYRSHNTGNDAHLAGKSGGDVAVLGLLRKDWQARLDAVPKQRRVFVGLQLFPEASLDYWLRSQDLLPHDEVILRYCEVLGAAGELIETVRNVGYKMRG